MAGEVTLTGSPVAENKSLEMTCTYTGTAKVQLFKMSLKSSLEGSLYPNCSVFSKMPNISLYEENCPTQNQLIWTIKTVTRANEGQMWTCKVTTPGQTENATHVISVQGKSV